MRQKIRFAGILITNPRRRRFLRLWLYLSRVEVRLFKLFIAGSALGVGAHYALLISLEIFTTVDEGWSLFVAYFANYNIKFFFHKYIVFKDNDSEKPTLEWLGYMAIAYINTKLTGEVKSHYCLDFWHTQLYTFVPTTLVMYLISRFIIFKKPAIKSKIA